MRRLAIIIGLLLGLAGGVASAQSRRQGFVPSGTGTCPGGVVIGLQANGPPLCGTTAGAGPINTLPLQTGPYDANGQNLIDIGTLAASIGNFNSIVVGSPSGGNKGPGTLNATNIYINGVAINTSGLPINSLPPQTADYNFQGFKGTNAGAATVGGDVLSWGNPAQLASLVIGAPTGGNEGAGTLNATGIYVNGVAVSAAGLPINSLPAQTGTYNAQGFGFINLLSIIAQGIIQYANNATNALLGFSINGTYNPVAYGADPTRTVESGTAIQAAIDAAEASSNPAPVVEFPVGRFQNTAGPLFATGNKAITIVGAGRAATILSNNGGTQNKGPSLVAFPAGFPGEVTPITATSLATGGGYSMNWGPQLTANYFYNLVTVWETNGSHVSNRLNGLANETIEFFINPVPLTGASNGTVYGIAGLNNRETDISPVANLSAYWTYSNSGTSTLVVCQSTTGNPSIVGDAVPKCTAPANITNGVSNYAQYNFDGSLHLATGLPGGTAAFVTATTSSGTTVNFTNDDFWLGKTSQGGSDHYMAGQIDGLRISNVVRNAQGSGSFTAPTAKPSSDGNTIALFNNLAIKNATVSAVQYPMAIQMTSGDAGWLVPFGNDAPSAGAIDHISDITIGPGVYIDESIPQTTMTNVNFGSQYFGGYYAYAQAYFTSMSDATFLDNNSLYQIREDGNSAGFYSDITITRGIYQITGKGGGWFQNIFSIAGGQTLVGVTALDKGDIFTDWFFDGYGDDAEEGGNFLPFKIASPETFVLENGGASPAGTSPAFLINNHGNSLSHVVIKNTQINGAITFSALLGNTTSGLFGDPIKLSNDNYAGTPLGVSSFNICPNAPQACQIDGNNTQYSSLGISTGPPSLLATRSTSGSGTTGTVLKFPGAQSGDVYIVAVGHTQTDPGTFNAPTGWTKDTRCSAINAGNAYESIFWHVSDVSDPASWAFTWTNSANHTEAAMLWRGANVGGATGPIDTCFPSHGTGTAVPMTGGTSGNINDAVADIWTTVTFTGVTLGVGATPPANLVTAINGNAQYLAWYTPASLTIPTVNYTISGSQDWAGTQIAVASKTLSATALASNASAQTMFQGMAGASFQSATIAALSNTCAGQATLSSGTPSTATVTNACITAATNVVQCTDNTSVGPVGCVPSAGSLAITGPNTVTDKVSWERVQ